jgi:hypothetical protein
MYCTINNCFNPIECRSLCKRHYNIFYKSNKFIPIPKLTNKERYESYIDRSNKNGCHNWLGHTSGHMGYGRLKVGKKHLHAHRYGWELVNGPIPKGLCICHKCDNPLCQNIDHLFLGTFKDNILDMEKKGRAVHKHGEENKRAKLTNKNVTQIRNKYVKGIYGYKRLAKEFKVSEASIVNIISRKTWYHI